MSEPEDINEYNFYKRMNEIGEYRYRNSSDTIFVFQLMFIAILIVIVLLYLKSIGIVTAFFVYPVCILLTIIVIFILVNRIVLTNNIRDKRDWSKLNFGDGQRIPSGYITAGVEKGEFGIQAAPPATRCRTEEVCD
uniref:Uncharacterized protein n=1 Tax=viral metagenome TaxID=1070528 RepID=A0A6C0IH57_9ZZZZ